MSLGRMGLQAAAVAVGLWACAPASAQIFGGKKKAPDKPEAALDPTEIVARVNGEPITRDELARELIEMYGKTHLDEMISRRLVEQACRAHNVEVTPAELNAELDEFLKRNKLRKREFEEQILSRQGVTLQRYMRDTIWPKLALLKLVRAKGGVQATEEDLQKAWAANFGEKVEVRMLLIHERRRAEEIWKQIQDAPNPEEREKLFEDLARRFSIDEATRPYGGRAAPIGRNTTDPAIEEAAFRLQPGELSSILQTAGGHLLLYCVGKTPARENVTLDSPVDRAAAPNLPEEIRTYRDLFTKDVERKKLVMEVENCYLGLKKIAKIDNHLTGDFDVESVTGPRIDPSLDPTAN